MAEQINHMDVLTQLQTEQSQEIFNALYDLLCAIVDTHERISEAFEHPINFVVGTVKEKILFKEMTTKQEVEDACKGVASQAEIIIKRIFDYLEKFCNKHPNIREFIVARFQKIGANATQINQFIIRAQSIVNLVDAVCPVLAAILSIINNILGLFGLHIPLL